MDFTPVSQLTTDLYAAVAIAELVVLLMVLRKASNQLRDRIFFVLALSALGLTAASYASQLVVTPFLSDAATRVFAVFTTTLTVSTLLLAMVLPRVSSAPRLLYVIGACYAVVDGTLRLTPYGEAFSETLVTGQLVVSGLIAARVAFALIFSAPYERIQPALVLLGYGTFFYFHTVAAAAFLLLCITAVMVMNRSLSFSLISRRTLVFFSLLSAMVALYSMAVLTLVSLTGEGPGALTYQVLSLNIITSILIGIGYTPISTWLRNKTDRIFFRKDYERNTLLADLSHKLDDVLALDEALEITMSGLVHALRLSHAATYIFQMGENNQAVVKRICQIGYDSHAKLAVQDTDFFTVYFTAREAILLTEKLKADVKDEDLALRRGRKDASVDVGKIERLHTIKQAVLKKLQGLDAAIAIPLRIDAQPIGVIILSPKLAQTRFDTHDLDLIDMVATTATTAIQKARLYESDQMKSEFVSIASHELLTPISAMEGYLSMILDENIGSIDGQTRGYLDKVYTSAKRLSALVKDMLSASRIDSGQMKVEPQQLDLGKVIQDSFDQLKFTAQDKKLKLIYEKPAHALPPVWADKDRSTQVLINLMGNAIKYTREGSVTVRTVVHAQDNMIEIQICDTGVGMDKDQQAHLFEKFYRVYSKDTADVPGTGLGLYITKSIVEQMGGTVSVESVVGKGSTFSFTVPIFQVESSHA